MRAFGLWVTMGVGLVACADISPIEDGRVYGEVVTLKDWFTSSYLLKYSDGAVLFDAGFRPGTLEKRLETHGVSPTDVTHVFITHGHGDHLGGLELLTAAQVIGMEAERNLVASESGVSLDVGLIGGETFTFDDVVVTAIAVPGHTPGNAVYRVGDTVVLGDSALVTGDGRITPVAEKRSDAPAEATASLKALFDVLQADATEPAWLVPAHSAGVAGLDALKTFAE